MKQFSICLALQLSMLAACSQSNIPSADVQIKSALLAAPAEKRDSAAVYGYGSNGDWILLRKGSNEIICIADDPMQAGFSVAAYHVDLQPYMERGRALRKEKKNATEIFDIREKETKEGKLKMPAQTATLFVFSAKDEDFNKQTGEVQNGYLRYVVYIPYATAASTGLPLKPEKPGMPWIMHPGTHGAHIMIS